MISSLTSLLDKLKRTDTLDDLSTQETSLASAALLVEVATIDQHFDDKELATLKDIIVEQLALSTKEWDKLIVEAKEASSSASSLYEFTRQINDCCDEQQKYDLMCGLWKVAYADGNLDKYEEHIIRRIADLIHIRHSEFIRAKHQVRDNR